MIGYIGGILLAICALPQAYKSYRDGHSDGLSGTFLTMWFTGEIFTITYILREHGFDGPLILNYSLNIIFLCVIIYYKLRRIHD